MSLLFRKKLAEFSSIKAKSPTTEYGPITLIEITSVPNMIV